MVKKTALIAVTVAFGFGCDKPDPKPDSTPAETTGATAAQTTGATEEQPVEEPSKAASAEVFPLEHGSFYLKSGELVVAFDPTTSALEAAEGEEPPADIVFVTHIHDDHLDPDAIARIRKEGAPVVAPQSVVDKAGEALPDPTVMANGDSREFLDGAVKVEAIAMYNLKRKRDNGEFFHPKGRGNGYVVTLNDERIYVSGDTECTSEMKALADIDVAFVCMNLPYTMTPEEASECIREFKPAKLIPYHYRGQDPGKLKDLLAETKGVEIDQRQWYPGAD